MSSSVKEAFVVALVRDHFKDRAKVNLWFETSNPMLGNVSPNQMIELGRLDKLLEFVQNSLAGYSA